MHRMPNRAGRRSEYTPTILKKLPLPCLIIAAILIAPSARYSVIAHAGEENAATGQIWAGYVLLKHITSCESWGDPNKEPREFGPDGKVLHGYPNPQDIGLGQINLPTWGEKAKELGFDLNTYDGNLGMSKWIFDHYGWKPWVYSESCWGSYLK
jgi:hypothetical protein